MAISCRHFQSPIGRLALEASERGLVALHFDADAHPEHGPTTRVMAQGLRWLAHYFSGIQPSKLPPRDTRGTPFQEQVWDLVSDIPIGRAKSYGEIAKRLGDANKSRAVGQANGRNPLPLFVPCHRVIGTDGTLTGYAGGLHRKQWLLAHEAGQPSLFSPLP